MKEGVKSQNADNTDAEGIVRNTAISKTQKSTHKNPKLNISITLIFLARAIFNFDKGNRGNERVTASKAMLIPALVHPCTFISLQVPLNVPSQRSQAPGKGLHCQMEMQTNAMP
jgi:hypothetical protein